MNSPHTHPRATEFLFLVNGQMDVGFIEENGARFVGNTLTQGQGTIFPKGSIHYQLNLGCEPITFVAALNDEDPGVNQIAQRCEYSDPDVPRDGCTDRLLRFRQTLVSHLMSSLPLLEISAFRRSSASPLV